jgi:pyridinium-3,5-bisthiocarboxylic acid mononucleotide nickel chelatase
VNRRLYLDLLGGMAGDMFIAAMLDAWPQLADELTSTVRSAGLPTEWRLGVAEHEDGVLRGKRFYVIPPDAGPAVGHQPFRSIVHRLRSAPMAVGIRERAEAIFHTLAEAEAEVHGVAVDDVTFHEIGAWDSVADIVGAACLIEALGPAHWQAGPVPLGGGRVRSAHGALPVPAPATLRLLEGFVFLDDGIPGERVTPTGAAILRHLVPEPGVARSARHRPPMSLARIGTGFGTQELPGISNVLRVMAFSDVDDAKADPTVGVVEFEVDDQTGEDLALGLELLRGEEGVLDVLQIPAMGKKGRLTMHVQVLCRPDAVQAVISRCFTETTTIGLRWTLAARATLERTTARVDTPDGKVAVKLAMRPGGIVSAKPEASDFQAVSGQARRDALRALAAARAVVEHGTAEGDGGDPDSEETR